MRSYIFCLFLGITLKTFSAEVQIIIQHPKSDTLFATLTYDEATSSKKSFILKSNTGIFNFSYTVTEPTELIFYDGKNRIWGIVENEDKVGITYDFTNPNSNIKITGQGEKKYSLMPPFPSKELTSIFKDANPANIQNKFEILNLLESKETDSISRIHQGNVAILNILLGYKKFEFNWAKRRMLNKAFPGLAITTLLSQDDINSTVKSELGTLLTPHEDYFGSKDYINDYYVTLYQEYMSLKLNNYRSGELSDQYNFYFTYLRPGKIRERVLCILLEQDYMKMNNTNELNELVKVNYGSDTSDIYSHFAFDLIKKYGSLYLRGQRAPDFSLTDADGKSFTLKDLEGKVVFIDFWFKECAPCRVLFENMKALKEKLSTNPAIVFLNISVDPKQKWLDAIKELNLHGYNAFTQGKLQSHSIIKDYKISGYPTACILDRKGNFFNASPPIYNIKALENQLNEALKQ